MLKQPGTELVRPGRKPLPPPPPPPSSPPDDVETDDVEPEVPSVPPLSAVPTTPNRRMLPQPRPSKGRANTATDSVAPLAQLPPSTPTRSDTSATGRRRGLATPSRRQVPATGRTATPGRALRLPRPPAASARRIAPPLLTVPAKGWACIAGYLEIVDLVHLAATCRRLRAAVHSTDLSITSHANQLRQIPPDRVPIEAVGHLTRSWPALSFEYTCSNSASGTFWSKERNEFVNMSMVAELAGLRKVSLRECDDVEDLTPLKAVQVVVLNRCNSVIDITPLAAVQTLSLEWCLNISSVAGLANVTELTIDRCPKVSSLEGVATAALQRLTIRKCRNVRSLEGLRGVALETLRLEQLHNVSDLEPVASVQKLTVRDCPRIRNIEPVIGVPDVCFQKCRAIQLPVGGLSNCPNVHLEDCGGTRKSTVELDEIARASSDCSVNGCQEVEGSSDVSHSVSCSESSTTSHSAIDSPQQLSVRVASDSEDWVAEAARLRDECNKQKRAEQLALKEKLDAVAQEERLNAYEKLIKEEEERELREAEERWEFEEMHVRAAERRRADLAERVALQAKAEQDARAKVEASAAAGRAMLEAKQQKLAEDRANRKERVQAMMRRMRSSD